MIKGKCKNIELVAVFKDVQGIGAVFTAAIGHENVIEAGVRGQGTGSRRGVRGKRRGCRGQGTGSRGQAKTRQ